MTLPVVTEGSWAKNRWVSASGAQALVSRWRRHDSSVAEAALSCSKTEALLIRQVSGPSASLGAAD